MAAQSLVPSADDDELPLVRLPCERAHLVEQTADAGRAAHHQNGEASFIEAEPPPQRLFLARRRRAEAHVDGKAEQLDAVARHPSPDRHLPRNLRRRDHQVGLAERPSAMEVDQVGDDRHEAAGTAAPLDRLVAHVVEQRMHGQDHVRVVLADQLGHRLADARPEQGFDGGERRPRVARVVNGAPGRARALDHRGVERRESPDDRRALRDQRVGDGDNARMVELLERLGQRFGRGSVSAARIAEQDDDPRWPAAWCWSGRRLPWRRVSRVGRASTCAAPRLAVRSSACCTARGGTSRTPSR